MKNKIQILFIHGGMTFKNRQEYLDFLKTREIFVEKKIRWSEDFLDKKLGDRCEIIRPSMPLSDNARYEDWKIHFERFVAKLRRNVVLIGSSLGEIFLAKYLSENKFPKKILATYLVCPPYDNSLSGESLVGGFSLKSDLSLLEKNSPNLRLLFSKDDNVVPLAHADKYRKKLKKSTIVVFDSKNGHFKIAEFPEIVSMIKKDLKTIA